MPNTRQPQDLPCCPPCVQAEGTTLEALQKLNPDVKNPDLIQPGQLYLLFDFGLDLQLILMSGAGC